MYGNMQVQPIMTGEPVVYIQYHEMHAIGRARSPITAEFNTDD